jgi:hypothetical protein
MSTRNQRSEQRSGGARFASATQSNTLNAWTDLPRRQLALMTHSATAIFRGAQELRRIQQEAAQRATLQTEEAAERLREPLDLTEVMALQNELVRFNLQETAHFWAQVANAALKWQADMVSSAGEAVIEGASEPTLESLQRAFEQSLNGGVNAAATTH